MLWQLVRGRLLLSDVGVFAIALNSLVIAGRVCWVGQELTRIRGGWFQKSAARCDELLRQDTRLQPGPAAPDA
jgi:hypothetical protein